MYFPLIFLEEIKLMDRRKFIRTGSVAGLAATTLAVSSCHSAAPASINNKPEDGKFMDDFELNEATIDMLQEKMKSGTHTSRSITQQYLDRIKAIDKEGPALNSVIEINPDAIQIADKMDAERKAGKVRGPMHGIPVLIKDNINTGDQMMTTAGSLALEGHKATLDAFVVNQLRNAGAVILGKTNLSEWANFRSTHSSSGWSSRGGQTRNACVLDRNPCGSSSGSGAAVAANLCAVAVGTETDGSVIAPSSYNGVVGIKPTVGLVSRTGIIPISATQDTAGPMTRTVKDAAILLRAMAGPDPDDKATQASDTKVPPDYTVFLKSDGLKGKRIGVEKKFLEGHEGVVALYKQAIELIKSNGATIVEVDLLKKYNEMDESEYFVLMCEFKDGLNRYLAKSNAAVKTLADVIAFNKKNESRAMPWFKQETLERSETMGDLGSKEYLNAVAKTTGSKKYIDDIMKENNLDAIAGTSIGPANLTDLAMGDYSTGFYFCPPAAMAGYPHITVPMGTVHELPVGISFIARAYEEPVLFSIAYSYEQASKKRTAPKFLKTIPS
jgi:amidase